MELVNIENIITKPAIFLWNINTISSKRNDKVSSDLRNNMVARLFVCFQLENLFA